MQTSTLIRNEITTIKVHPRQTKSIICLYKAMGIMTYPGSPFLVGRNTGPKFEIHSKTCVQVHLCTEGLIVITEPFQPFKVTCPRIVFIFFANIQNLSKQPLVQSAYDDCVNVVSYCSNTRHIVDLIQRNTKYKILQS